MILYAVTLYLAFFAAGFPAGLLSIVWTSVSEKMTLAVPYVSLLRAMAAAGAVTACILSARTGRKRDRNLDLCLAGVSLEALGVIGFSMSRVFWNLLLWSFILGLGCGISLTLLCMVLFGWSGRNILICFSGIPAGTFAGTWILSSALEASGSWRTACQILGITQILISVTAFLIRRAVMKDGLTARALDRRRRKRQQDRERVRRSGKADQDQIGRAVKSYLTRTFFSCAAAFITGILTVSLVLWPQSYRVVETGAGAVMTGYGLLCVSMGMASGCLVMGALLPGRRACLVLSGAGLLAVLLAEAFLTHEGALSDGAILRFQFMSGVFTGNIFPGIIMMDDVRLDPEAELGLIALAPAFLLGSYIVVTPLTQALVGSGQTGSFALWLLAMAAADGVCLFFSLRGEKG